MIKDNTQILKAEQILKILMLSGLWVLNLRTYDIKIDQISELCKFWVANNTFSKKCRFGFRNYLVLISEVLPKSVRILVLVPIEYPL